MSTRKSAGFQALQWWRDAIVLVALTAYFFPVIGQNQPQNPPQANSEQPQPRPACLQPQELENTDLFGSWVLELQTSPGSLSSPSIPTNPNTLTLRLQLKRNPEYAQSLAGEFELGASKHEVFGDIEDGALELEESDNGKDIIALWKGVVSPGSCGRAITGTRRMTTQAVEQIHNFILRRAGW